MFRLRSLAEIIVGLGEMVTPIFTRASSWVCRSVRGSGLVRALAGARALIREPVQVFPQNKFHDDHRVKQDFF